jgi:phage FluMu protein Com
MKKQNAKINIHREPRKRHTAKRQKPPQRRHIKNNQPSIKPIFPEGIKTMTQKILCAKCYKNLFYAEANILEELILKCKSCGEEWNLRLKPTEQPLITFKGDKQ